MYKVIVFDYVLCGMYVYVFMCLCACISVCVYACVCMNVLVCQVASSSEFYQLSSFMVLCVLHLEQQ